MFLGNNFSFFIFLFNINSIFLFFYIKDCNYSFLVIDISINKN